MRKTSKIKALIIMLIAVMLIAAGCSGGSGSGSGSGSGGSGSGSIDDVINSTAAFLAENIDVDSFDAMGGGWAPFAVKLSGTDAVDDTYFEAYYDSVRAKVKSDDGVLSEGKPTANERVSINLWALGYDPTSVEGYDLMKAVDDYDAVKEQGMNAELYALISANYGGYKLKNEKKYLKDLIESQNDEGAFGMDSDHPDVDMTAMAVQALSYYMDSDDSAAAAVDKAVEWMSSQQQDDGSYGSAESTAQVAIALGCIGKDAYDESAFTKGDNSLYEGLMVYRAGEGFLHTFEESVEPEPDMMATEQALLGLEQIKAAESGGNIFAGK